MLGELAAADPNVKVVFRHLPLPIHPWALHAARASSCARGENFWKLHDFYFEKQRELTAENVAAKTREVLVGLQSFDIAAFDQCVAGDESLDAVRRDVRAAALLGVNGGAAGFDILTVRAADAGAALKLISRSPLVSGGIVKAEVVEYRPADPTATP